MRNSVIKICNFVHYIFRKGGYLDCDQFSLSFFTIYMGRGGPKRNSAKFIIFSAFFGSFPYGPPVKSLCGFLPVNEVLRLQI